MPSIRPEEIWEGGTVGAGDLHAELQRRVSHMRTENWPLDWTCCPVFLECYSQCSHRWHRSLHKTYLVDAGNVHSLYQKCQHTLPVTCIPFPALFILPSILSLCNRLDIFIIVHFHHWNKSVKTGFWVCFIHCCLLRTKNSAWHPVRTQSSINANQINKKQTHQSLYQSWPFFFFNQTYLWA